jgi:hypothetical protein
MDWGNVKNYLSDATHLEIKQQHTPRMVEWLLIGSIATFRNWPGRDSAGIKLLAEFRTFSRVRERLAYANWIATSTGGLWPLSARVDLGTQFFPRLKVGHRFRWDPHGLTGSWVAPSTWRPVVEPEASETAYFNAVPLHRRVAQCFKNGLDRNFSIFGSELREEGSESVDEFGADHRQLLRGTSAREWWQTTQRQARQHR